MKAGRKRAFDKEEALDSAMRVFWENGYSGTSVTDLTTALGINKPSMYSAFGNKEQLFTSALEHYLVSYRVPALELLTSPPKAPLKERMDAFLMGVIDVVADNNSPKGCFYTKSCCESGSAAIPDEITSMLSNMELDNERILIELLEVEKQRDQLPKNAQLPVIAGYLLTVMTGLSVQAKNGSSREELKAIVDMVVGSLPIAA